MSMYGPSEPPAWGPRPPGGADGAPQGDAPYPGMGGGYGPDDPRRPANSGGPPAGYQGVGYATDDPAYQSEAPYDVMDPSYEDYDEVDMVGDLDEDDMDDEVGDEPPPPNGGVAAAIVAGGIGCAVLGLLVVAASASDLVAQWLTFYEATGPLSGKAIVSVVVYLVVWPNLHFRLRDKQVDLYKAFMITILLVAVGVVGTFPPFYQLFG
jgi:hypothetical protein